MQKRDAGSAPLRFAVCHTFSSSFLRSGSFCVLYATSFISSFIPLHCTRSQPGVLLQVMASRPLRFAAIQGGMRMPLRKAIATVLTGFHYAPIRPPFTSVASSPLAAFCCCARLAATGCVAEHRWHKPALIRLTPYATRYPFTVRPSPRCRGALLSAPAGGTRRQFRRASSIALTASSQAPVWTSVPHQLSFLWPQALLPCPTQQHDRKNQLDEFSVGNIFIESLEAIQ